MARFAIVAGKIPVKRPAPAPLSDNPVDRAKARYIAFDVSIKALVEEFKGQPGCGFSNLARLSAEEDWPGERQRSRNRTVMGSVNALENEEIRRNVEHLRMTRNTLNTVEGILSGVHSATGQVLDDYKAGRLTLAATIAMLRNLATAARNVAMAQGFGITLEQRLGQTEGSGFQRFAEAADTTYREVMEKRAELVKRADEAADRLEAEQKGARGRAGKVRAL